MWARITCAARVGMLVFRPVMDPIADPCSVTSYTQQTIGGGCLAEHCGYEPHRHTHDAGRVIVEGRKACTLPKQSNDVRALSRVSGLFVISQTLNALTPQSDVTTRFIEGANEANAAAPPSVTGAWRLEGIAPTPPSCCAVRGWARGPQGEALSA